MNYRYGLLAVVLAVSSFAAPTLAGVTDLGGGEDVKTTYSESNHYKDKKVTDAKTTDEAVKKAMKGKSGFQSIKDNITNTKESAEAGGTTTIKGTLHVYGHGFDVSNPGTGAFENASVSSVTYTKKNSTSYGYWDINFSFSGEDAATKVVNAINGYYSGNGHDESYVVGDNAKSGSWDSSNVSWINSNGQVVYLSYTEPTVSSLGLGSASSGEAELKKVGGVYSGTEKVNYQTDEELDHSTLTTTVTSANNTVMVGDPDDVFSAYCANGGVTVSQVRDNYYNRTLHMATQQMQDKTWQKETVYTVSVAKAITPIVLDLDGDGKIEASNGQYLAHNTFSNKVALFDFYNNGFPVMMEWVGADDGLLCRPNADGSVNGSNLFGVTNGFENGYEEMASLDTNNDGQLTGTELEGLKVWTDANGDAFAQANELKSLDELGITSIKVSHNNYTSTFVRNGQTFKSFDWWPNAKEIRKVDMASVIK